MKKFISIVSAAAFVGASALAGTVPVSAAPWHYQQQDRYIGSFCDRNPGADQCYDWRSNRSQWSDSQYRDFYRIHRNDSSFSGSIIAGLFGFAFGAAMNGTPASMNGTPASMSAHVRACQNRYRSYDARTDSFLGYDGRHHLCRL